VTRSGITTDMVSTTRRPRILFFTNSESGQANVMLATLHELLIHDEYDIHLASFAPIPSRLAAFLEAHSAA
jgi:hypothetical protein